MATVPEIGSHVQISSYDWTTGETTYNAPAMDAGQRWRCAISQATEAARARFPHSNDRIERAYALVTEGKVVLHPATKTATVTSSDGTKAYTVNGHCDCPDAPRAPEGACKHKLSALILRKASVLVKELAQATAPVTVKAEAMDPEAEEALPALEPVTTPVQMPTCPEFQEAVRAAATTEPVVGTLTDVVPSVVRIPREFLYDRKGTTAILWGGLLHLAHASGLHSMKVDVVTVTPEVAVMQATARFNDGGEWTDIGDASPSNVGKTIAPHYIRMASTRAMARCLRVALDIPFVCAVELSDD